MEKMQIVTDIQEAMDYSQISSTLAIIVTMISVYLLMAKLRDSFREEPKVQFASREEMQFLKEQLHIKSKNDRADFFGYAKLIRQNSQSIAALSTQCDTMGKRLNDISKKLDRLSVETHSRG